MPHRRNTTPNTAETTINVPRDWVRVVMMMDLPDLRIRFHTSYVPIINPTAHSKIWVMAV